MTISKLSLLAGLLVFVLAISPTFSQEAPDVIPSLDMELQETDLLAESPDLGQERGPGIALDQQVIESDPDNPNRDSVAMTPVSGMSAIGMTGSRKFHGKSRRGAFGLEGELALTDAQYEKLFEQKKSFLNEASIKLVELKNLERDQQDLLSQVQVDRKKIKDLQSKINAQREAIADLKLDKKLAMQDILTAEQRKELRLRMIKGGKDHGHRGVRRHGRG
jgi:Spy/CpxP family protein refolding chaperone